MALEPVIIESNQMEGYSVTRLLDGLAVECLMTQLPYYKYLGELQFFLEMFLLAHRG